VAKRVDAADTVDPVIHFLHRLQAEGWGVRSMTHEVDYERVGNGARLPVEATVLIKLEPSK